MIYVDSNCWIYWMDARLPEHRHTLRAMRRAVSGGILMNYATLVEVSHYLRMLPAEEFADRMATIQNLSTLVFADLDDAVTRRALDLLPEYSGTGLGARDCVILATMNLNGVKEILTHDQDFLNVEGIRVVDPIPAG